MSLPDSVEEPEPIVELPMPEVVDFSLVPVAPVAEPLMFPEVPMESEESTSEPVLPAPVLEDPVLDDPEPVPYPVAVPESVEEESADDWARAGAEARERAAAKAKAAW